MKKLIYIPLSIIIFYAGIMNIKNEHTKSNATKNGVLTEAEIITPPASCSNRSKVVVKLINGYSFTLNVSYNQCIKNNYVAGDKVNVLYHKESNYTTWPNTEAALFTAYLLGLVLCFLALWMFFISSELLSYLFQRKNE